MDTRTDGTSASSLSLSVDTAEQHHESLERMQRGTAEPLQRRPPIWHGPASMPSSTTALVDGGSHGSCTPELDRSPSSVSSATFGGPVTPETAQGEWAMRVTAVSGPLDAPIESLAASSGQGSSTSVSSPHRRHGVTVRDVVEGRQRPYAIVAPADELVYAQRLGPPIDLRPTERRASQAMSTSSTSLETPPSMADLVRMVDAMKTGLKAELKAELSEIHAVEMADVRRAAALEVEESRRRFERLEGVVFDHCQVVADQSILPATSAAERVVVLYWPLVQAYNEAHPARAIVVPTAPFEVDNVPDDTLWPSPGSPTFQRCAKLHAISQLPCLSSSHRARILVLRDLLRDRQSSYARNAIGHIGIGADWASVVKVARRIADAERQLDRPVKHHAELVAALELIGARLEDGWRRVTDGDSMEGEFGLESLVRIPDAAVAHKAAVRKVVARK